MWAFMAPHACTWTHCECLRLCAQYNKECAQCIKQCAHYIPCPALLFAEAGSARSLQGACKSFDAAADGYVRSDGIAAVVLRGTDVSAADVSAAAWWPRQPYACVLASATNNDGHTREGITFPSGAAQRALAQEV